MDECKYAIDISKGFPIICYNIGCNNTATTTVKLPLNKRLCCVIHVCDSCLPKYQYSEDT
jgi:hypothetical protein